MSTLFDHLEGAPMPESAFVIYSCSQAQAELEMGVTGGFWNNENGWSTLDQATIYAQAEDIGMPLINDAQKVTLAEAFVLASKLQQQLEIR